MRSNLMPGPGLLGMTMGTSNRVLSQLTSASRMLRGTAFAQTVVSGSVLTKCQSTQCCSTNMMSHQSMQQGASGASPDELAD